MTGPRVLRVFRFRPTAPEFDSELRTILLPDLVDIPGVVDVFAGRRGLPGADERIVASVWVDRNSMTDAVGEVIEASPFHPELLDGSADRSLLLCELEFGDRAEDDGEPTVLRLVEGTVRPGEFEAYVAAARAGLEADLAAGRGPMACYLGRTGRDSFVTLSIWADWSTLQAATGGDVNRPIATRHAERLIGWTAAHFEALAPEPPEVSRPRKVIPD